MRKKGISLIVLVITIIVIIIIASAIISTFGDNGIVDKSKKARFMSDFKNVEEGVSLYSSGRYNASTGKFDLPLKGYLTEGDKTYITESVPTLNTKIEELSGSITDTNLAWISSESININLSNEKKEKGYIMDVTNGQIYDYIGDVFEGKRWHTLDDGVVVGNTEVPVITEELWNGWIKLTLFYPAGSTEKKWRLGTEGELRADPMLMWQNYTGPITIPIDRVKDVWIKYILNSTEVVIPPAGTLLVDIVPDKTGTTKVSQVNIRIDYEEGATTKEYRVGDSGWITYNGEFSVTENCIVEARVEKTETIYNTDGSILTTRNRVANDKVYIGNIGVEETTLAAPTITRLAPVGSEKARVLVVYPETAARKIYKVNYGIEEDYTSEINVANYGTYILAYYYDSTGKRSQASAIYINDTSSGGTGDPPVIYDPKPPYETGNPPPVQVNNDVPAPTISVNPTTLAEEVQVSVNSPANADKVYIKLGRYADYQEYTMPITVRQNMEVYAYYRTYTGDRSNTGFGVVSNIKQANKPYVYIDANPYPKTGSYGASSVTVTINYSDTDSIEYSEDGIVYNPYTAPFTVTQNKTIYARGTNAYGVTETSLNITNIGKITPPAPIQKLTVNINANPEPLLSTDKVTNVNVTIDYDSKATEKYYSIGEYGTLQTYTGAFDVTNNCSIYAYAKGDNARGEASKTIDNLLSGISQPIITATPGNNQQASKVTVSIEFDKYATIKQYSLDGAALRDYTGEFEVTKNGTVIYAYSENSLGQSSEASYTVQNIVPEPPILVLEKPQYYLLKLSYPIASENREYKWKENGEWKVYKTAGILLIKPQYKDQLIQNGTLIQIEDENGDLITFTGDYYFIDVPISELSENLFMRWDREPLGAPQIVITPTEAAMQVTANIAYNSSLVTKQYKVINPGETTGIWMDYTGPITIDRNNAVIYARGMDDTEVWTAESMLKVTNIDENPPVIKLTADLDTAQQKVAVKVNVTDDVAVGKIKWAAGTQGESYFASSGTEITNDSIVNITSNGYYTFYSEDKVGNKQVYTLNVTNVDLTPPIIDIAVSSENTVGLTANVTINYGDSTTKQYKVGTSNSTWSTYTAAFDISSNTVLANNWQNEDGTVTIYAKGKDSSNNEITVQKKVVSLDLDKPTVPVISSNSGYATLYEYGARFDLATTITYDTRTDIDNYYSIDNGTTWISYTGQFDITNGTVIAKSVKKSSGLETVISKTVAMPTDAIKKEAYDGNDSTYSNGTNQYMMVDSTMQGKNIRIYWGCGSFNSMSLRFLDENKGQISSVSRGSGMFDDIYLIPENTKWIMFESGSGSIYEIGPSNEPTFTATNGYMLLAADPAKAIKEPYQSLSINYFQTSVQRLYRIGTTGDWLNYNDQPIRVNQGLAIYAKGIDQYGNETRIIPSYTANVPGAMKKEAYDGNDTTLSYELNQLIQVDSSMQGKNIRIRWNCYTFRIIYLRFLDENNEQISFVSRGDGTYDDIYLIPENTKWIKYETQYSGGIYEIGPSNVAAAQINPTTWTNSDVTVTLSSLFDTDTIKYSFDSTNWYDYTSPIIVTTNNKTIYTKVISVTGGEFTRTITVANIDKVLPTVVYETNGKAGVKTASTVITVSDTGGSALDTSSLQYVWDTQNITAPDSGWTSFTNGTTLTKGSIDATCYLWIKANDKAGNIIVSKSNAFVIDNTVPESATMSASPTSLTNGNVLVTIAYPTDVTAKQYSTNGSTWITYSSPISVTTNNTTVYARGLDAAGNISAQTTLTVANIDKSLPTVVYGTNGATDVVTASTTVTVNDVGISGLNESTLQYVWASQNTTTPTVGWISFANGETLTKTDSVGPYYLWVKAADNVGNIVTTKSNVFTLIENVSIVSTIQTENTTINGQSASYNNPIIPAGFVAVNTLDANWSNVSTDWDKGLVVQDASGNQFVWVPVDGTSVKYEKWCTVGYAYNNTNISDDTLPADFNANNITTTYKGFYIARYESMFDYNGGSLRAASKKSANKTTSNWSTTRNATRDRYIWNFINYADSKMYAENMAGSYGYDTTKIGTNLTTGAEWDTVMKWVQNSSKNITNSTTWGNYNNSTTPANIFGFSALQVSGYSDVWKAKNIYDLAGNMWELTNEKYSANFVMRGGPFNNTGSTYSSAYRTSTGATSTLVNLGFRVALYIK